MQCFAKIISVLLCVAGLAACASVPAPPPGGGGSGGSPVFVGDINDFYDALAQREFPCKVVDQSPTFGEVRLHLKVVIQQRQRVPQVKGDAAFWMDVNHSIRIQGRDLVGD